MDAELKRNALINFLDNICEWKNDIYEPEDVIQSEKNSYIFSLPNGYEYAIYSKGEADNEVAARIKDTMCYLSADFICEECGLFKDTYTDCEKQKISRSIRDIQRTLYEHSNPALQAIIERSIGMERFIEDAIAMYSRSAFLHVTGNGLEEELHIDGEVFYIYRINC